VRRGWILPLIGSSLRSITGLSILALFEPSKSVVSSAGWSFSKLFETGRYPALRRPLEHVQTGAP